MTYVDRSIPLDRLTLRCRHTPVDPGKANVMIALPFGVPNEIADAAFDALALDFNVVTWETRYILDLDAGFSGDEPLSPASHVGDMLAVLSTLGVERCYLVGYCSGAGIALLAARAHPDVFSELVLVNGEYQLFRRGHDCTDYQRSIDVFMPAVAQSRAQATSIFGRMADIARVRSEDTQSELLRRINRPFVQEECLYRYAKNYMGYRDFDALSIARQLNQRTLVIGGKQDQHSSAENSRAVSAAIGESTSFVLDGDHYEFCRPASPTLQAISAFLAP